MKQKSVIKHTVNIRTLTFTALLGAVSAVLMAFNFSIPFAPTFLKFDISELPALFAGFFMGPAEGCAVVLVKILLKVLTQGTAANPLVDDLFTLMLFGVFPFNLIKHGITSLATYLVYKKCGNALRGILRIDARKAPGIP